jgi:predicted nucleotidyltransferase
VTEAVLAEVVSRVLSVGTPQAIILFGSQARGDAGPSSDIDLLIIEESALPRFKRAARYLKALTGLPLEKDVVVWTPNEVQAWKAVPNAFVTTAMREGRSLYARSGGPGTRLASERR